MSRRSQFLVAGREAHALTACSRSIGAISPVELAWGSRSTRPTGWTTVRRRLGGSYYVTSTSGGADRWRRGLNWIDRLELHAHRSI
jgi:hypothetical protein